MTDPGHPTGFRLPVRGRLLLVLSYSFASFRDDLFSNELECGQMPNVMAALQNIGGILCSTLQSLTDAHYFTAVR